MNGTYVVIFSSDTGVQVYGVFSAAHVERSNFDMWAWKQRWEAAKTGLQVQLSLCWFEIKPERGPDGVERFFLPAEPL